MSIFKKYRNAVQEVIIAIIIFFILCLLAIPTFKFSVGLFGWIGLSFFIAATLLFIGEFFLELDISDDTNSIFFGFIVAGIIWALAIIFWFVSSSALNAYTFRDSGIVELKTEEDIVGQIPDLKDIENISLMDTESAKILGDRTVGVLTDLVSQFVVSDNYYTIVYQEKLVKVAPLYYGGVIKAITNENIPGYVIVDPISKEAEYMELETGMKISPSGFFAEDLRRHVWSKYPNVLLGEYTFQLDEEGVPYWIYTTYEFKTFMGCPVPNGIIICNAVDGKLTKMELEEIPEWVELVYSGDVIEELYNRYGAYQNGFLNAFFGQKGVTQTTDDFGYIRRGNDVCIYTGITSVVSDESNLGFIICNTRTGIMEYYPIAGAEEYSAMAAAEGNVQNFGYTASFPSLVMVGNDPTYVMVLKDQNGLVKQYAMVNMRNYNIAVYADTIKECQKKYVDALETNGTSFEVDASLKVTVKITVDDIFYAVEDGNTVIYLISDGIAYKQKLSSDEEKLFIQIGDTVELEIQDTDSRIKEIY